MQTLKVSVSLPDATHPDMELRLSADDSDCGVVIALPVQIARVVAVAPAVRDAGSPSGDDDYVLSGYAGI